MHQLESTGYISANFAWMLRLNKKYLTRSSRLSQSEKVLGWDYLSVIKLFVDKHNGKIECISALGEGTEFVIQIPLKQVIQSN